MKKIIVSMVLVGAVVAYIIFRSTSTPVPVTESPTIPDTSGVTVPSPVGALPPTSIPMGQMMTTMHGYRDGTFTGDAVDAFYGIVQVQAVIANGLITKVTFLKYPNDRENTIRISNESMPVLIQEAITVQSAKVDILSGATQTSEGFQQSLATALARAKS